MLNPNTYRILFLILVASCPAHCQEPADQIQQFISGLNARKIEDRAAAQSQCESLCLQAGAPQSQTRESLCKAIGATLESGDLKPHAKIFLIKQLERIGRSESLGALNAMLSDERLGVRDAARRALATNPAQEATRKLIDFYARAEQFQEKKSTINALGYRCDSASVELLTKIANKSKGPLKYAAINALSKTADPELSPKTLRGINDKDALLRFADRLADQGKSRKALGIYRSLLANNSESTFVLGALRGILASADEQTVVEQVLSSLSSENKAQRQVATGHMRQLSPSAVAKLTDSFAKLSDTAKEQVVLALGTRSDAAGLELVSKAATSDSETLRRTAIEALGGIGNKESLTVLLPMLETEDQDLASASIMRLRGTGVNERLASALATATSKQDKSSLLRLLQSRRATNCLPSFVSAAASGDADYRDIGISALSRLGEAHHLNAILDGIQGLKGTDRERGEKQVVNMCRRIPAAKEVLSKRFTKAATNDKQRLVSILGRVGGASSLSAIRELLKGQKSGSSFDAAVSAMANWPDHEVAGDLKRIVLSTDKKSQKVRALRGLARVSVLGGEDNEKLEYLKFVFDQATRNDEKILALERAKAVRTVASLEFVLPHIQDKELGPRAQRTVVDLAHHRGLREPNREKFEPALRAVAKLMKDERQQERIQKYLANE